jgi:hypothetical protein
MEYNEFFVYTSTFYKEFFGRKFLSKVKIIVPYHAPTSSFLSVTHEILYLRREVGLLKPVFSESFFLPLVGISTLLSPNPSLASECAPPPEPGGGGYTRLRVRGWGSPNSDVRRKSLALCLLCASSPS